MRSVAFLWSVFITRKSLNTQLILLTYCCRNFYNKIVIKFGSELFDDDLCIEEIFYFELCRLLQFTQITRC
jgi:hypothetical protein